MCGSLPVASFFPEASFRLGLMVCLVLGATACQTEALPETTPSPELERVSILKLAKSDGFFDSVLPEGFPAAQDLAIIFPLRTENGITADSQTDSGQALLSEEWLNMVSDAYLETEVADALELENFYSDWRIVSLRLVPCGPLGIRPDQQTSVLCWPQVRLVWQPVMQDIHVTWMMRDFYADDRAIHALYHVMPEGSVGEPVISEVAAFLKTGANAAPLDSATRSLFLERRDAALERLVNGMVEIRGSEPPTAMTVLDIRSELQSLAGEVEADAFTYRLANLLGALCEPEHLFELTSFSLPEGRNPAGTDIWTFIAFDGQEGSLIQKPITVVGKNSGAVIGHAGMDETVGQTTFDEELVSSLDDPEYAAELEANVAFSQDDLEAMSDAINDGGKTLVPNTSCATCHRYNPLKFDFHNLSHLEDLDTTIAPRVKQDVSNDLIWLIQRLGL